MSDKIIRVLIVEDHYLARLAAATFVGRSAHMQVVGEVETGWEAIALYDKVQPDVVLMDLRLPQMDGVETITHLRKKDPTARILVLSHYESEQEVKRALDGGALGYVTKDAAPEALAEAIRTVSAGEAYLPAPLAERLESATSRKPLSRRELEVLECLSLGRTNQQIAHSMGLTEGTVRIYVSNILFKLQVKRRTEAVSVALERGLVRPPS